MCRRGCHERGECAGNSQEVEGSSTHSGPKHKRSVSITLINASHVDLGIGKPGHVILRPVLAIEDGLPIFVQLKLGDLHVGRVNTEGNLLAVGLIPNNSLDMNHELLSVHLSHFALAGLVGSPHDHDLDRSGERESELNMTSEGNC